MLSNKMTFSLTCFVVLIAFGLVCLAPPAFGDGATGGIVETVYHDFDVKITAGESMIDVDATDHSDIDDIQIATGRDRASRVFTAGDSLIITLLVEFTQTVQLHAPEVIADDEPNPEVELMSGPDFGEDDILIQAFDVEGRPLGTLTLAMLRLTMSRYSDSEMLLLRVGNSSSE